MIRHHKGEEGELPILARRIFGPMHAMFQSLVREGIASGELIEVEWMQMVLTALGGNVFYFLSAPVWRLIESFDPFEPAVLKARRAALVGFLGQAIFQNREQGAALAARVLADMPMPDLSEIKHPRCAK